MVDTAIDVAAQEKARYFAERIARTEKARAYMDGVMYKYANDPDCVAFKWKLSSRHPCDDICDLYARADLWGSDEAGNHGPLSGSDSASIFIFFHPKAQHICYNKSNIVKF